MLFCWFSCWWLWVCHTMCSYSLWHVSFTTHGCPIDFESLNPGLQGRSGLVRYECQKVLFVVQEWKQILMRACHPFDKAPSFEENTYKAYFSFNLAIYVSTHAHMMVVFYGWLKDHSTIVADFLGRHRVHTIKSSQGGIFHIIKAAHWKNTDWA